MGRLPGRLPRGDEFTARVRELLRVGSVGLPAWRGPPGSPCGATPTRSTRFSTSPTADGPGGRAGPDRPGRDRPDGATTLDAWQPDKEGRLLAYQLSHGGDEESLLRVMDVATGELVDGPIDRCRYSGVAWLPGGKAFYYTRRLPPEAVPEARPSTTGGCTCTWWGRRRRRTRRFRRRAGQDHLLRGQRQPGRALADHLRVDRHRAARGHLDRRPGRGRPGGPGAGPAHGRAGRDGLAAGRAGRQALRVHRPGRAARPDLRRRPGRARARRTGGTSSRRTRRRCCAVTRSSTVAAGPAGPRRVTHPARDQRGQRARPGHRRVPRALELPGIGTVGGIGERPEGGHEAWFGYTDYTTPPVVLRYDATTGTLDTWAHRRGRRTTAGGDRVAGDLPLQGRHGSPDGDHRSRPATRYRRSGARSCILYGYGGFDISQTPGYSANILAWVEAGGVYAVAGLRGGSEEGEEWHRAGMLDRKQNVFDDFHAAAEYLIAEGITARSRLAVWGGSNGGLLVGAAVTQRPDAVRGRRLLGAAARHGAVRAVQDRRDVERRVRLRRETEELGWLLGYSPYHHVRDGVEYPAVLFTVFSNDTRVDPLTATRCAPRCSTRPRRTARPAAGRRAGRPRAARGSLTAALAGDCLAFVAQQTGLSGSPAAGAGPAPHSRRRIGQTPEGGPGSLVSSGQFRLPEVLVLSHGQLSIFGTDRRRRRWAAAAVTSPGWPAGWSGTCHTTAGPRR